MGSLTDRELALRLRLKEHFQDYAAACLKIKTKAGTLETFRLNRSQRYLHDKLEAQRREKGRVRALVLKGRQVGISTYISGRFYWRGTHSRGFRTYILAHLDDASQNLFTLAKRFHDNCPSMFKPETGAANAKELAFPKLDGGYKVATAGGQEVGRSDTIHLFHGSEMAFWPFAEKHSAGLQQAIAETEGTEDIRESTANGIGNAFYSMCKAAQRGDSEYELIFIPWFWHEEYAAEAPVNWIAPDAFRAYGETYKLTLDQVFWAWRKNRDLSVVAGGSPDEINWKFRQEYPANAEEAFQTSGADAFISPEAVMKARKTRVEGYGPLVLGVDPARGGGDKTGIIDRQGRRLGGNVCKRIDHNDLMAVAGEVVRIAQDLRPKGLLKIFVDTTGLGAGLYDRLREQLGDGLVQGVNFGEKAHEPDKFANRRAEMWDRLRAWMDDPAGVQIPDDDVLHGEMTAPVRGPGATRFDSSGRLIIEAKDHIRERLNFSPDLGDAAALTHAAYIAERAMTTWRKPRLGTIA